MLVILIRTNIISKSLQKVQPVRMTGGFLEGESIIYCLYIGIQGVSEVGKTVWKGLGRFFMVD